MAATISTYQAEAFARIILQSGLWAKPEEKEEFLATEEGQAFIADFNERAAAYKKRMGYTF